VVDRGEAVDNSRDATPEGARVGSDLGMVTFVALVTSLLLVVHAVNLPFVVRAPSRLPTGIASALSPTPRS